MKLIQSEKNYFYKLYKNGKKKRISFEIYQKGGVGKSEAELIKELTEAGKYDEWFRKGHSYGITMRGNRNRRFYEWTLIDGSTRKFSTITESYWDGQINIPVFDFIGSNSNYVGQSSFLIVPNSKKLHTFGMSTCSGLTMKLRNQKFLSHIDAITNTSKMLSAIQECLRKQNLTTSDISNVKIYRGPENSNRSYQIIHELLERLSIPKNNIEVIISRDGKCSI